MMALREYNGHCIYNILRATSGVGVLMHEF